MNGAIVWNTFADPSTIGQFLNYTTIRLTEYAIYIVINCYNWQLSNNLPTINKFECGIQQIFVGSIYRVTIYSYVLNFRNMEK